MKVKIYIIYENTTLTFRLHPLVLGTSSHLR